MCGIAGIVSISAELSDQPEKILAMTAAVAHRGPDGQRVWIDRPGRVALGHARLAVVDLSEQAAQPFHSASGRYVVTYNGEIYNFSALREELASSVQFRSRSDTEVVVAAIEEWGFERAVERLEGMFAFAAWDTVERRLYLARDRFGQKPLFYLQSGDHLIFGSELKVILAASEDSPAIDRQSLAHYLRFAYVPHPTTIFDGIAKLPPQHYLKFDVSGAKVYRYGEPVEQMAARLHNDDKPGTFDTAVDRLEEVLTAAVRGMMISDVPLGAFLSGGIDSSVVVALMQEIGNSAVQTFSIGFKEQHLNEAVYAKKVAQALGTDHTELYVSVEDAFSVVAALPEIYDEPFADSSQIPTVLVSRLAKRKVTVALTGDCGDELFGGYTRYTHGQSLETLIRRVPFWLRRNLATLALKVSPAGYCRLHDGLQKGVGIIGQPNIGDKIHKLASILQRARDCGDIYKFFCSQWFDPAAALSCRPEEASAAPITSTSESLSFAEQMMLLDLLTYVPNDSLVKVDRAAMAVGLETRVPYLDIDVVRFALTIPLRWKLQGTTGKPLLRAVLSKRMRPELFARPKMGFGMPVGEWLLSGLRDWAEDLLSPEALSQCGFFNVSEVRRVWSEHLQQKTNHATRLWCVLVFQQWYRKLRTPHSATRVQNVSITARR